MIQISKKSSAILLGLFDSVHIGHRKAVRALCESDDSLLKTVYTFESLAVDTKGKRKLILTDQEKLDMLLSLGADGVVFGDFGKVRELSAEEFVRDMLIKKYRADTLICGENFRFGKGAKADAGDLSRLCEKYGLRCKIVELERLPDGVEVSTTHIRRLLENGDIEPANRLLGYRYFINGNVVHGSAFGRTMGIKTVNLDFNSAKLVPPNGVYSTDVLIDGCCYMGVTNIGVKPTVSDLARIGIETHILGFDKEIYDKTISIIFNRYYRREMKFNSSAELSAAIGKDIRRRKEEAL